MKNILVTTDFSDVAMNALKFAIKIAHPLKSKIILFHSVHPILVANDAGMFAYPESFELDNTELLNKEMDELIALAKQQGVDAEKIILKGLLGDDISSIIEAHKIDLVVTGTSGAKGLDRFFFGSNSVNLFEKSSSPVLIVPAAAKYHSIKKIMYATDFQFGDIHEIEKICRLAQPFNAEIIVTHVNTDPFKIGEEKETMDWFAEIGDSQLKYKNIVYKLIYNHHVVEALEKASNLMNVDILCMSTAEKSFFEKLISKSNTKEMAFQTSIPLLTLHLGNENKLD